MQKKVLSWLILLIISCYFYAIPAQAQNVQNAINGLNKTASSVSAFRGQTNNSYDSNFLASKAGQIISLVLSFVGVVFLVLMIYAGISWMTSNGNEQTVSTAKNIIINSTIGIIIVFAAYALISFLGSEVLNQ